MKFIFNLLLFILVISTSFAKNKVDDFDFFLSQFATDTVFQLERTIFPLKITTWKNVDEIGGEIETRFIMKNEWNHESFYYYVMDYRPQIFDNYSAKLRKSNRRLFQWIGVETGVSVKYYFKRIKGNWFLIKMENLGD